MKRKKDLYGGGVGWGNMVLHGRNHVAVHDKPHQGQQQSEEANHTASAVKKKSGERSVVLNSLFPLYPGHWPVRRCQPHLEWGFPLQLNLWKHSHRHAQKCVP